LIPLASIGVIVFRRKKTAENQEELVLPLVEMDAWMIKYSELNIQQELGSGMFGVVYLSIWRDAKCVVKQMHPYLVENAAAKDAFMKEAHAMKILRPHPAVVALLGVCIDPNYPLCIVTEWMSGGSLLNLINQNVEIPLERVREFALAICSGMNHIHHENIIHCDLAARNCLIEKDSFKVKISDFGMSKVTLSGTYDANSQTQLPIRWAAPEVLTRKHFSKASDVWSFGVLLWELLEKKEPYYELTNPEVIQMVVKGIKLSKPENCPNDLWEVMMQCWQDNPSDRPDFQKISKMIVGDQKLEIPKIDEDQMQHQYFKTPSGRTSNMQTYYDQFLKN